MKTQLKQILVAILAMFGRLFALPTLMARRDGDKRRFAAIGNNGQQVAKVALMAIITFAVVLNSGCATRYEDMRDGKYGWQSKTIALEAERACKDKPASERRACIERYIDKTGKDEAIVQLKILPILLAIGFAAASIAVAIVY